MIIKFIVAKDGYADDVVHAGYSVESYLENSDKIYDFYNINEENSGELKDYIDEVKESMDDLNPEELAAKLTKQALIESRAFGRGYKLKIASRLLCEEISFDVPIYNIESDDYSIPNDPENYWVVEVYLKQ